MPAIFANANNTPVSVNAAALIALSRYGRSLSLLPNRFFTAQSGAHQSPLKGRGMVYDESRLYQPGDDIRSLDWRLTARSGKAHTKLFCGERERPVFVWVDYRASMFFATRGSYKSVVAAEAAALLIWNATQNGNRIGAILFSEHDHREFKPRRGRSAALYLIDQLARHSAWKKRDTVAPDTQSGEKALLRLRRVVRPGSVLFLLSDFRHLGGLKQADLVGLSRHNEVAIFHVYDMLEQTLPPAGYYQVRDHRRVFSIDTRSARYRSAYHKQFIQHRARLQQLARATPTIHYIECTTQDKAHLALSKVGCKR